MEPCVDPVNDFREARLRKAQIDVIKHSRLIKEANERRIVRFVVALLIFAACFLFSVVWNWLLIPGFFFAMIAMSQRSRITRISNAAR